MWSRLPRTTSHCPGPSRRAQCLPRQIQGHPPYPTDRGRWSSTPLPPGHHLVGEGMKVISMNEFCQSNFSASESLEGALLYAIIIQLANFTRLKHYTFSPLIIRHGILKTFERAHCIYSPAYCTCFHHLLHVCWLGGRHALSRFHRSRTNVRLGEPPHPPLTHTLPPPSVRLLHNGDKLSFLQLELDIRRPIEIMFGYVLISVQPSIFIFL